MVVMLSYFRHKEFIVHVPSERSSVVVLLLALGVWEALGARNRFLKSLPKPKRLMRFLPGVPDDRSVPELHTLLTMSSLPTLLNGCTGDIAWPFM